MPDVGRRGTGSGARRIAGPGRQLAGQPGRFRRHGGPQRRSLGARIDRADLWPAFPQCSLDEKEAAEYVRDTLMKSLASEKMHATGRRPFPVLIKPERFSPEEITIPALRSTKTMPPLRPADRRSSAAVWAAAKVSCRFRRTESECRPISVPRAVRMAAEVGLRQGDRNPRRALPQTTPRTAPKTLIPFLKMRRVRSSEAAGPTNN